MIPITDPYLQVQIRMYKVQSRQSVLDTGTISSAEQITSHRPTLGGVVPAGQEGSLSVPTCWRKSGMERNMVIM